MRPLPTRVAGVVVRRFVSSLSLVFVPSVVVAQTLSDQAPPGPSARLTLATPTVIPGHGGPACAPAAHTSANHTHTTLAP